MKRPAVIGNPSAQGMRRERAIEEAIEKVKLSGEREFVRLSDGSEAYAYRHPRGVAWGLNAKSGMNTRRGIRRPSGRDEAVS